MTEWNFLSQLLSLTDEGMLEKLQMLLMLVSLVLALMQCYFGYRFLKFWISVLGFILGAALGITVSLRFFEMRTWYPWAIGLFTGLLFAFISFKLYLTGVFIFSGGIAAAAVYACLTLPGCKAFLAGFGGETIGNIITIALCIAALVLFGSLSVRYSKPIIITVTSLSGAMLASSTLVKLIPTLGEQTEYRFIAAAALGISGVLLQHLMNLGKR